MQPQTVAVPTSAYSTNENFRRVIQCRIGHIYDTGEFRRTFLRRLEESPPTKH